MGDASLDPGQRMKGLADAASDFKVDNRIPIRRYFRYTLVLTVWSVYLILCPIIVLSQCVSLKW